MLPMIENSHLYNLHELQHALLAPFKVLAKTNKMLHRVAISPLSYTKYGRSIAAACELAERVTHRYGKPEFGIHHTVVDGKTVSVKQEVLIHKPFCKLLRFTRDTKKNDPKLLIVAPMSGHHATLLRGTVEALLPFADVYITDWIDGRDVPMTQGEFHLDDYVSYVMEFTRHLGPDVHLLAVCQPSVPVMAAVSIMAEDKDPKAPRSMTLIGGPIDTRVGVTKVNETATQRPLSWFESHVITRVPFHYPGFMRRVYPGFLQLGGFMSMNLDRHVGEHLKLFQHLVEGDGESASAHKKFYNEYLSVCDLPAEFYLETIDKVFQRHLLPKGELTWQGRKVDPGAITKTALLAIEGELDDISGVGQTQAALKLTKNLPASKQKYHLQKGVGHYGIFNGRRFKEHVVPVIVDFMKTQG